jgi:hypothetical protein
VKWHAEIFEDLFMYQIDQQQRDLIKAAKESEPPKRYKWKPKLTKSPQEVKALKKAEALSKGQ